MKFSSLKRRNWATHVVKEVYVFLKLWNFDIPMHIRAHVKHLENYWIYFLKVLVGLLLQKFLFNVFEDKKPRKQNLIY